MRIPTLPSDSVRVVMRMEGTNEPYMGPKTLVNLRRPSDLRQLAIGCDADIGGSSSAHLDFVAEPDNVLNDDADAQGYARFWGDMRLNVRSGMEGKMRSGYAGFRTRVRCLNVDKFFSFETDVHSR